MSEQTPNLELNKRIFSADGRMIDACSKYGWGWGGAEYHEVAQILRAGRDLEQLGEEGVWKRVVDIFSELSWTSQLVGRVKGIQNLIGLTRKYAEGIKSGQLVDLDSKGGEEANTDYVLGVTEKLERILAEETLQ